MGSSLAAPNMWNTTVPFLNPDTYLNHLTPEQGIQLEVLKIVNVFALGVS